MTMRAVDRNSSDVRSTERAADDLVGDLITPAGPEVKTLLDELDRLQAKATFIALAHGGWKCVVSGIELPPHQGHGRTGYEALAEVLRLAKALGHGGATP